MLTPLQLIVLHEMKERFLKDLCLYLTMDLPSKNHNSLYVAWKLSNHRMTLSPLNQCLEESVSPFYLITEPCLGFF